MKPFDFTMLNRLFCCCMVYRKCRLVNLTLTTDVCVTLPHNFRQVRGYPHISRQNIEFVPFFAVNILFHVLDISRLQKMMWVSFGGEGGGCSPWSTLGLNEMLMWKHIFYSR